jgi:hypothetical protein
VVSNCPIRLRRAQATCLASPSPLQSRPRGTAQTASSRTLARRRLVSTMPTAFDALHNWWGHCEQKHRSARVLTSIFKPRVVSPTAEIAPPVLCRRNVPDLARYHTCPSCGVTPDGAGLLRTPPNSPIGAGFGRVVLGVNGPPLLLSICCCGVLNVGYSRSASPGVPSRAIINDEKLLTPTLMLSSSTEKFGAWFMAMRPFSALEPPRKKYTPGIFC